MQRRRGVEQATAERQAARRLERLTTPMVSVDGELRPATWDEALQRAADGFSRARDGIRSGVHPHAFGMFSCSKATNEVNYLAQKFARLVIGSNHIDSCNRT